MGTAEDYVPGSIAGKTEVVHKPTSYFKEPTHFARSKVMEKLPTAFPVVTIIEELERLGVMGDYLLASALDCLLEYRTSKSLSDLKNARWYLDYKITEEEKRAAL